MSASLQFARKLESDHPREGNPSRFPQLGFRSNSSLSLRSIESNEQSGGGDNVGLGERFDELIAKYPFDGAMSRGAAWREFEKLS